MSERIRVLIVDDEPLARRGVEVHLERAGGFEMVGEAATGAEAADAIARLAPQVVFLDVQMPDGGGFDVVERVGADRMPITVFVTAYDEHALRAFDAQAIDYVLKPIDPMRFARTVGRVRALVSGAATPRRLLLRDGGRALLIDYDDIGWIEADGDYVRVYVSGRGHLVRHTLAALEQRLDASQFVRVHRSTIVNVRQVREARPDGDRSYRLLLKDGTALRVSRGYRQRLMSLLGWAVPGTGSV